MLTAVEAEKHIGTIRTLNDGSGLNFPVKIVDMRQRFGKVDAQVTPVGGAGARWVEIDRLGEVEE